MRPSVERLRELFTISPDGALIRLVRRPGPTGFVGAIVAGKNVDGYLQTRVDGYQTYVHRVIFAIANGCWPIGDVDHIDGDRTNNAPLNLRDVSRDVNKQNIRSARPRNKLGVLGVSLNKASGKYRAQISAAGRNRTIGEFSDPTLAHQAYVRAKRQLHEGCTL